LNTKEELTTSIFEKFRTFIKGSKLSLIKLFKESDPDNSGKISFLEFKSIIKRLGLGLSYKEID
jgi:Ca2+-binding EF-hand superfamily protein